MAQREQREPGLEPAPVLVPEPEPSLPEPEPQQQQQLLLLQSEHQQRKQQDEQPVHVPPDTRDGAWLERTNADLAAQRLPIVLERRTGRGVGVFAARPIKRGELIGRDMGTMHTVSEAASDTVCACCLRGLHQGGAGGSMLPANEALERCAQCSKVSYCTSCRAAPGGGAAWHSSSLECPALVHPALQLLPPAVENLSRQLVQLLARQAAGDDLSHIFGNVAGAERPHGFGGDVAKAVQAAENAIAAARAARCRRPLPTLPLYQQPLPFPAGTALKSRGGVQQLMPSAIYVQVRHSIDCLDRAWVDGGDAPWRARPAAGEQLRHLRAAAAPGRLLLLRESLPPHEPQLLPECQSRSPASCEQRR